MSNYAIGVVVTAVLVIITDILGGSDIVMASGCIIGVVLTDLYEIKRRKRYER